MQPATAGSVSLTSPETNTIIIKPALCPYKLKSNIKKANSTRHRRSIPREKQSDC